MTKEILDDIVENGKFKRVFQDYLNYFFVIFPAGIGFIGYVTLSAYLKWGDRGLLLPSICFLSIGLSGVYYVLRRLHGNISFTAIPINNDVDFDDLCEELKIAFKRADIFPDANLRTIEIVTKWSAFSWGERVTIILEKERILINSQPCGQSQPITILKDDLNIRRVKRLVREMQ